MKKAIIGFGGFAREVMAHLGYKVPCFISDKYYNEILNNTGNMARLMGYRFGEYSVYPMSKLTTDFEVLIAIADPKSKEEIISELPSNIRFFNYIHPTATILDLNVKIGYGTIICAGCVLTTNITVGNHVHLNLNTTVGHDTVIDDYVTTAPGVHISGNCIIKSRVYIGTNATVKEKVSICSDTIIGMNAGVISDINTPDTYIGTPAKPRFPSGIQ